MATSSVTFFLNGEKVVIDDPSPDLLLIDYLRSDEVGLKGSKKGCGQGGCGACTVILSRWSKKLGDVEHESINSCLRPVCALDGLSVTTIEGTGTVRRPAPPLLAHSAGGSRMAAPIGHVPAQVPEARKEIEISRQAVETFNSEQAGVAAERVAKWVAEEARRSRDLRAAASGREELPDADRACHSAAYAGYEKAPSATHTPDDGPAGTMNPVAYRLAMNNGTQCGYCTPGFVMNMSALLAHNPRPTKRQIEEHFDGNLCRCTGYRPILTGMKTFASDWSDEDEARRMHCLAENLCELQPIQGQVSIPFPDEARSATPRRLMVEGERRSWLTATSEDELVAILKDHGGRRVRMVHGNTSYGIYKEEYEDAEVLVDIRPIRALYGAEGRADYVHVGAGVSYTRLINTLRAIIEERGDAETSRLGAALHMAHRTAGVIVRNAASIGGNAMLVLGHIHSGSGEPFPSDLATALVAVEAKVGFRRVSQDGRYQTWTLERLVAEAAADPSLAADLILLRFQIPLGGEADVVMPHKVALREVNSHSLVNATTRLELSGDLEIADAALVFGGIAPYPWRAERTEAALRGARLSLDAIAGWQEILAEEVTGEQDRWRERMREGQDEGVGDDYKRRLAVGFLYKSLVNALVRRGASVPEPIRSAGTIAWGHWPVSDGTQDWSRKQVSWKSPLSQPVIKLTAMYQAMGRLHYTRELPLPPTGAELALVPCRRALASYRLAEPSETGEDWSPTRYFYADAYDTSTEEGRATAEAAKLSARAARQEDQGRLSDYLGRRYPGFLGLITCDDIPTGGINLQGIGLDQPVLAEGQVLFYGQSVAAVAARTEQEAIAIAEHVSKSCIAYRSVEWGVPFGGDPVEDKWLKPILTLEDAIEKGSIYPDYPKSATYVSHVWQIVRPGSRFDDWVDGRRHDLDRRPAVRDVEIHGVPCKVIASAQVAGGQAHFYMEPQTCLATPDDRDLMVVHPSTQSPQEMHQTAAMALGVEYNQVEVRVKHVGGGYGGKTEQTRFVVGPAVVAARALRRPVRLAVPREDDTALIGKRHAYFGQVQIAVDASENEARRGLIVGLDGKMWGDGGAYYDCSFIVSNCVQLRADNAYRVPNFRNQIDVCRTNKAPSTAFRAFGDIQGKLIIENAIDEAAHELGMSPVELRARNMYERGDVTPFGQALTYCYMRDVWSYVQEKSDYQAQKAEVDDFNARNTWRKQGIYVLPVKYGSGYNFAALEQAAVVISVYQGDGSVVIRQGGVEMGQGLMTQVTQVAAYVLNLPMSYIRLGDPDTGVIPNPTSTGGSTGTAYNGEAVKRACEELKGRLIDFGYQMQKEHGDQWCHDNGIDFWNYPEFEQAEGAGEGERRPPAERGWRTKVKVRGQEKMIWQWLVGMAYQHRVSLTCGLNAPIRGGEAPVPALTWKPDDRQPRIPGVVNTDTPPGGAVDSFVGFTFSAACSRVEVDVLTGEVKVLRSDLVYDMGWSLNPALDIGQVEGAFVQGLGYLLTEHLAFQPDGVDVGRLNSVNTWRYKPPATTTIPLEMNVHLYPRDRPGVPDSPNNLFSAKEVGEPPLVLAASAFFAVKDAIRASRRDRELHGPFRLDAPATVQEVSRALFATDR